MPNFAIRVVRQTGDVLPGPLAGPQPHVEGIEGKVGAQRGGHLPADHHAREDVEDERGVDAAGVRADVGQVGDPQLVRRCGDELALDQVGRPLGLGALAGGGFAGVLPGDAAQALGLHQPLDGAASHRVALEVQLSPLECTVDADVVGMDLVITGTSSASRTAHAEGGLVLAA